MTPSTAGLIVDRDREKKLAKSSSSTASQNSEDAMPSIGPHNPALGEIYQRLYPEMRRPKPNQEAIAAALQAMQRLTMEADSQTVAEDAAIDTTADTHYPCRACGHHNREGNKFCGGCGLSLGATPLRDAASPSAFPTLDYDDVRLPQ